MSASGCAHHRQVGPAADHDAADVLVVDHGAGVVGAGDTDHQQLGQLVAGRHRRKHVAAGGRQRVRRAAAGPSRCSTVWALRREGFSAAGRAAHQQAGQRRERHPGDGEGTCAHVSLGRMDRFLVPAAASIVVGLLLGAAAIFGITLMVQQDTKPPVQAGDPASAVLNRVEYGDRS